MTMKEEEEEQMDDREGEEQAKRDKRSRDERVCVTLTRTQRPYAETPTIW